MVARQTATWKALERRVAEVLGGERVGCTGQATADVLTPGGFAVEVKHREKLPAWLTGALAQAERNAPEGYLPLVVLHEHGRHDSLVVLRLSLFTEWFGD